MARAEIQVYSDEASSRECRGRVEAEDEDLQRLWTRYQDICEPDGWRTVRFESLDFQDESFVRGSSEEGYLNL
jgi:hypothetical protein